MRKPRIANRNPVVLEVIKKRYYTYEDLGFYDSAQMIRAAQRANINLPSVKSGQRIKLKAEIALLIQQHKV